MEQTKREIEVVGVVLAYVREALSGLKTTDPNDREATVVRWNEQADKAYRAIRWACGETEALLGALLLRQRDEGGVS